jgi:hypothetical protein
VLIVHGIRSFKGVSSSVLNCTLKEMMSYLRNLALAEGIRQEFRKVALLGVVGLALKLRAKTSTNLDFGLQNFEDDLDRGNGDCSNWKNRNQVFSREGRKSCEARS